ncbi:MAG: hypothetical protein ACK5OX_11555 [Desertimonas sp.]
MSRRVYYTCRTDANGYCSATNYMYSHAVQAAWVGRVVASQGLHADQITGIGAARQQPPGAIVVA